MHDIGLVRRLLGEANDRRNYLDHLLTLKATITVALAVLWLTGLALVSLDIIANGWGALANPKLQAKIGIVVLLSVNGGLIHARVIPALMQSGSLMKLDFRARTIAIFAGSVSGVSWFYAVMLGVGRPLAWKYSLLELLVAYPFLVLTGFSLMMLLTAMAEHKRSAALQEQVEYVPLNLDTLGANTNTG
jgi:hypothetical protein